MTAASAADAARLPLMLSELRLPTIACLWPDITARADKEGWPAARLLAALAELELADRARRRIERHLAEARLPPGKTLATFNFTAVPTLSKAHVIALAAGTGWLERGANLLMFGPPGSGKSHACAGLGQALVENGYRVQFARTPDLVQRLQLARHAVAAPGGRRLDPGRRHAGCRRLDAADLCRHGAEGAGTDPRADQGGVGGGQGTREGAGRGSGLPPGEGAGRQRR